MRRLLGAFLALAIAAASAFGQQNCQGALVERVATAISITEGWNAPGSIARLQLNPGCLRFVGQKGARSGLFGYAVFEKPEDGWAELRQWIIRRSRLPLRAALSTYNLGTEYADRILASTKLPADLIIAGVPACK